MPDQNPDPSRRHTSTYTQPQIDAKHRRNTSTAAVFRRIGFNQEATALDDCTVTEGLYLCPNCLTPSYHVNHCKLRYCSFCGPLLAKKRARIARAAIRHMTAPKWLTLTTARAPNLAEGLSTIRAAWKNWIRRAEIRKRVAGGIYKIECLPKPDGWHVHIHAIIDATYLPIATIWRTWAAATGQSHASARIMAINEAIHSKDIAKYTAKLATLDTWEPDKLQEYLAQTRNVRMYVTFGKLYNKRLDEVLNYDDPQRPTCPHCGSIVAAIPIRACPYFFGRDWGELSKFLSSAYPDIRPSEKQVA